MPAEIPIMEGFGSTTSKKHKQSFRNGPTIVKVYRFWQNMFTHRYITHKKTL